MRYFFLIFLLLHLPAVASTQVLSYGYAHFPPFMCSGTQPHSGIDLHLIKEIARRLGVPVEQTEYPFKRLLMNMRIGQIDIMSSLAKRPDREEYMTYLTPSYYELRPTFYVRKGNENIVSKYEDLYKTTIGLSAGSAFFDPFDHDKRIKKYPASSELQLLKMLDGGRIKVIIGSNAQMDFLLRQQGLEEKIKKAVYRPEKITKVFLVLSRRSPFAKNIDKFNQVLQELMNEKLVEKFISKGCNSF